MEGQAGQLGGFGGHWEGVEESGGSRKGPHSASNRLTVP